MLKSVHQPPYTPTQEVSALVAQIWRLLGQFEGRSLQATSPKLRRSRLVSTVHGTCAIEGNALSAEQVTRILEGKRVIGHKKEILEIENTHRAYTSTFDVLSIDSLLAAHAVLMENLIADAGHFRRGAVVVGGEQQVVHVAPPADRVPGQMQDLFTWLSSEGLHIDALVRSAIFHYEFEFIHPFSDGNGRLGRLWQHLLLVEAHPAFEAVPVESIVRDRQKAYYEAIATSSAQGNTEPFVRFSLETIQTALETELTLRTPIPVRPENRLASFLSQHKGAHFSRSDYLKAYPELKAHTASRDLAAGVAKGFLEKIGNRSTARYQPRKLK